METDRLIRLTWLGQGGFLIEADGVRVAVDPYLSQCVEDAQGLTRLMPPPVSVHDLRPDILVCTHDHLDHFDPVTVPQILNAFPACRLLGPESIRMKAAEIGIAAERYALLDRHHGWNRNGLRIQAIPAFHSDPHAIGLLIQKNTRTLYISGDTQYRDTIAPAILQLAAGGIIDCACVCINGRLGNMSSDDAAIMMQELRPALAIPMHYGLFSENTADPEAFIGACRAHGVAAGSLLPGVPAALPASVPIHERFDRP